MVNIRISTLTISSSAWGVSASSFPDNPTVMSGAQITWGGDSCLDHPEPTRCLLSLWVPRGKEAWIPALGDEVRLNGGAGTPVRLFTGKVEEVKLSDDHKAHVNGKDRAIGGYRLNVIASDALAEAAKLRLSAAPWPWETVSARTQKIYDAANDYGVTFDVDTSPDAKAVSVGRRDVDALPALEAYQRTVMAMGKAAIAVDGVVQASPDLKLPKVLLLNTGTDNVLPSEITGVPNLSAGVVQDIPFTKSSTTLVNQVKVSYREATSAGGVETDRELIRNDPFSVKKNSPQERSLESDMAWVVAVGFDPSGPLVTKAENIVASQGSPQWTVNESLTLILKNITYTTAFDSLYKEATRFGQLIKISGAPGLLPQFLRVRGGTLTLGAEQSLQLDVEPVEYSAPPALTRNSLAADSVAKNYTLSQFKNLTSYDLRSIGARQ